MRSLQMAAWVTAAALAGLMAFLINLAGKEKTRVIPPVPAAGTVSHSSRVVIPPGGLIPKPPRPEDSSEADEGLRRYSHSTDEGIEHYLQRVKENPADFISYRILGELYERKAGDSGDHAGYAPAEEALRKSLELAPDYPRGLASMAYVLCARHKFADALEFAQKLRKQNPNDLDGLASMGDALIELGEYSEAEQVLQELHRRAPVPEALARLANLAELKGELAEARQLMQQAVADMRKLNDPKAVAWYLARSGDVALAAGDLEAAESFYRAVPEGTDPLHDATAALGRIRIAQGRLDEAIDFYRKAIDIGPDPHMLAALGDLYVKQGQPELAEPLFAQLVRETKEVPEYRRELATFYADHDREVETALELAEADLPQRRDIYAYDILAWTLLKNGRAAEAAEAMRTALRLNTQDPKLFYHAGMIYAELGETKKAREYLQRALNSKSGFSVLQMDIARNTLAKLQAQ